MTTTTHAADSAALPAPLTHAMSDPLASAPVSPFADPSDRLVRHLFDSGLRLHKLRTALDATSGIPDEVRSTLDAALDDLDVVIREAGMAMLAVARETHTAAPPLQRRTRRKYQRW